ncbi:hypothetical protein [Bacillus atrophaeus]|uniref:Rok-like winged helix domain-containing protein n=1 Tax=Bacillus atrophaeus TaxID=1452 RepID=UPI00227F24C5|nr:hypothetical protein [Bacillus atrophaeus]MCY8478054.1 hypothetical protein [Bacillus atrophaeus]
MQLKKGDHVVLHTIEEAKKYDGEIHQCASDEFQHIDNGKIYNAVRLKGLSGIYDVSFLQRVRLEQFLKKVFNTNPIKPETIEMQNYIYNLLLENPDGMYSKEIQRKMKEEKNLVYSNITVLMKRVMESHPEIKKPYNGFYVIEE